MSEPISEHYGTFYRERNPLHVYPVEFVVRAFLGNYPRHKTDATAYEGRSVLDIGFGDGRNMPLLHNLGLKISGIEITQEICALTNVRMKHFGIPAELRVGRNHNIPFEDDTFDFVLASHACYYVDHGKSFNDNIREISRVLRVGGTFVFSAPMPSSYIMTDAEPDDDGHMFIRNDPYGVRNGYRMKKFDDEAQIKSTLSDTFESFEIGKCRNDFWGIEEHVWIVVCKKKVKL